jgi:hypothetical protein
VYRLISKPLFAGAAVTYREWAMDGDEARNQPKVFCNGMTVVMADIHTCSAARLRCWLKASVNNRICSVDRPSVPRAARMFEEPDTDSPPAPVNAPTAQFAAATEARPVNARNSSGPATQLGLFGLEF